MKNKGLGDPRERILHTATALFAQKGFAAVGVREIARSAGVNIAMISYYYQGKIGILRAVLDRFFGLYNDVFRVQEMDSKSPEECVHKIVHNLVDFVRTNTELAMVAYNELPLDTPEIAEYKAERISQLIAKMKGLVSRFHLDPEDVLQMGVVGPSLVSMIFMNFRIRPLLQRIFKANFDDAYYQQFAHSITTLFLDGVKGMAAQKHVRGGAISA